MPQTSTCSCRTLTPTCPRTFKTAVCPASNPPNASAGLQGNNSYSYYMPLPSVFQGVQDCRLPALKPPKRFQPSGRPPRQQLLQLLHAPAICFSGGSRLPFARPQTPQTLPTLPQASKATTLTATCPCHPFRGFKTAVASTAYMPLPSVFQGVQDCRLPALKPPKRFQRSRRPPRQQLLQLCPCHLFFRGFKTAVCPPSNPQTLPTLYAGLQGNNSYSYMSLPSVFHGVQDCRLPGLKPSKRFRRPPRQQLLQLLHAPAICFSGGSRLPFARPQTPQTLPTLPQASKATTLTATCPCHLFFRGFKTAVCPPSNPPNASNAPAGLQGNNSYSYMSLPSVFQGVQDCRSQASTCPCHLFFRGFKTAVCPASNPPNASNAPASGLQGNNSYSTATCPCHLFFRGFKTAVCPPSNPPNASNAPAGLQGNNSYSYMPLPSVFQGVQDCRLPALKPPKRFQRSRRPPRQQLLQLPSVSYMPLPSVFQPGFKTASQCNRTFTTAVCPASNPPNASAGLQGNNSYSYYMPLPSVFQGVQDCRLPALKPPKRFQRSRRPPRQQLLQLHAPAICFSRGSRLPFARPQTPQTLPTLPQASKATTLTATCLPGPAICFSGGSRLPFARPQTPAKLCSNAPAGLQGNNSLQLHVLKTLQTLPTLPQASKATTLTATCPCHLFFRGFKTAVCPPSNPPNASNALAGLQGNNSYSYMSNAPAGLRGNNSYSYMPLPSVFQGVQDCRLPGPKPPKRFQPSRRPPRQQLLQLHAPAICFSGGSRLPFARPQTPQTLPTLPQASKATTLTATCPCHLFFRGFKTAVASTATCPCHLFFTGFKTAVCPASNPPNASSPPAGLQGNNSYSYMPLPSVFQGVQDCRLPALKPPKRFQRSRRPPRQQLLQLHVPAICFSGGSRLPSQAKAHATFARPQTLQTLPHASKATTLTATTCPCHLFFRGFKTAVCPPSNPPNASNAPAGLQGNNSYSYMPLPSVFHGVQDCRLPGLKPPKRFQPSRRPPRQQLLQLHAPAICFSGGSRLPFARPQTPQTLPTLPQASKATTLTATCPCHLFFRGFKTAVASKGTRNVCPASNPPNASARLQGNNSYSYYMPLPSVFQGVQDCRLPALKPPKRFQRSRRPPRQQLLQLHAPAICFSRGSRLPFARPQTSQTLLTLPQASKATTLTATCPCHLFFRGSRLPFARPQAPQTLPTLPQASKATTLTATCPCHLFFRGFKTAVASKGTRHQGNTSVSYMPSHLHAPAQLLHLHAPATFFSGRSRLPFARPQTLQTLPQASKATTLTAPTCPCHLFFRGFKTAVCPPSNPPNASNPPAGLQGNNSYSYMPLPSVFQGVQDCRLPALKPPKRFQRSRRPPRQQLLQLHVPAICFSGGSRLPFARPQTPQTLPTLPQASKATTLTATCPCHLFFRGFKTAVCPPSNPPNASNPPGVEQIGVVSQRRRGRRHPGASPFLYIYTCYT